MKVKHRSMPVIRFHEGTLILEDWDAKDAPPYFRWDHRQRIWRAMALYYPQILAFFNKRDVKVRDEAVSFTRLDLRPRMNFELHFYQKEALDAWESAGSRGSVVLPTGSGKSYVALKAIEMVNQSTLIVLPTIDLMNQWYDLLTDSFGTEVGILGGGYHQVAPITVATYDSAYLYIDRYGDCFALLVFDEVHHLPSPKNSHIPQMSIAPYRLGLTATYRRLDNRQRMLDPLIGRVVYRKTIDDLKGEHLSDYEIHRLSVELAPQERNEYQAEKEVYEVYVRESGVRYYGSRWERFIKESAYDRHARRAMVARTQLRRIIWGSERKLDLLESLLKRHHKERVIIFTENNDLVYRISQRHLIPAITHHTRTVERKEILDRFREGTYRMIVTSKVLNEGVDVPEANVAIILSGNASPREYLQRLGRILRKKSGKKAMLYEVVIQGTDEVGISYRRRRDDAYV